MLSIENLGKRFGSQVLYQNASFSLGERERIGIVGPNGAGKSTFFKILTQLEDLDEGKVHTPNHYDILLMEQEWHPQAGDTVVEATLRVFSKWHHAKHELMALGRQLENDESVLDAYQKQESVFLALGGFQVEHEIKEVLSGLGFKEGDFDKQATSLSGGWRMRCYLAGLLIQKADLLLLDEPTNHLDMDSVVWFENFILNYPHSVMMISHDRRLIETIATKILEFSPPKMTLWPYGLQKFESSKVERMQQLEKEMIHKQREIDKLKDFARRFGAKSTKARQAQNKLKSAVHFENEMEKLKQEMPLEAKRRSTFTLSLSKRQPKVCIQIEDGVFGYQKETPLFAIKKIHIESGKAIGVIGDNGVGKTTFLRTVAGEIDPLGGMVQVHQSCKVSLFTQHRMEELPLQAKAIDYLIEQSHNQPIALIRSIAASLGLSEVDVDKNVAVMSGGEKARLSLARILLQKPDILLLDEPTNHLDMQACDSLIEGLQHYEGTVIVVSHNRDFLDAMVDQIYHLHDGVADVHLGNYSYFSGKVDETKSSVSLKEDKKTVSSKKSKEEKRLEAQARQEKSQKKQLLQKQVNTLEEDMDAYKEEMKEIDAFLMKPEKAGSKLFSEKLKRRGRLQSKLELAEEKWIDLQAKIEDI